jgi:8-hydroxy-5-deazaflavin:NADPH oxidoreductase
MRSIAVIGSGNIGGALSERLAAAGREVTVGVRAGGARDGLDERVSVASIADAVGGAGTVVVAIPGGQVQAFAADHGAALAGKVVIDATNDVSGGDDGSLSHTAAWAEHAPGAVVARAFSTLGFENYRDPTVAGQTPSLLWCGPDGDAGAVVEDVVRAVGLDPVRIGGLEAAAILDGMTRVWFQLVFTQRMGRRLAFRLLRDEG